MARRLRLWSGLVLFAYLTTHFVNHALGLISLQAMEEGRVWLLALWHVSPANGTRQAILLVVAWLHGCIGLHFWLRLRAWYPRIVTVLFAAALLLPILALLGFAKAGIERVGPDPKNLEPPCRQGRHGYDVPSALAKNGKPGSEDVREVGSCPPVSQFDLGLLGAL